MIQFLVQHSGLWFLIAYTFNMWALISVARSGSGRVRSLIWAAALLVPVFGFIAWYLVGPRERGRMA